MHCLFLVGLITVWPPCEMSYLESSQELCGTSLFGQIFEGTVYTYRNMFLNVYTVPPYSVCIQRAPSNHAVKMYHCGITINVITK